MQANLFSFCSNVPSSISLNPNGEIPFLIRDEEEIRSNSVMKNLQETQVVF